MFNLSSPKQWSPFQMVLGNYSERPASYYTCQRLLFTEVAWDSAWNTLMFSHTSRKTLALSWIFLNAGKGCPLRLCSLYPQRFLRPGWVTSWATGSELTAEPAWEQQVGLETCRRPFHLCGSGDFNWACLRVEDGRVAGNSVLFFSAADVPASGKEKMSRFKYLTGSSFSTAGDF